MTVAVVMMDHSLTMNDNGQCINDGGQRMTDNGQCSASCALYRYDNKGVLDWHMSSFQKRIPLCCSHLADGDSDCKACLQVAAVHVHAL